jgi:hypothetical protein
LVFNDFIKDDCIQEGDGQVASGSVSLPDHVVLKTEEQMLERELNEGDVLDALGEYKCDAGMSVEDVAVIVNIKTLKGRLIANKFNTGWSVGVTKCVEKTNSVAVQLAVKYRSETYCWTPKLNREDYGVDKYWALLAVVKRVNTVEKQ